MKKLLKPLLALAGLLALTLLVATLANLPGTLRLVLGGYQAEMSLALAAALALILLLATLASIGVVRFVLALPRRLRARAEARRRGDGDMALATALMALARGDGAAADQATKLAQKKLPDQPLPRLMAAQAALLADQPQAAEAHYRALLADTGGGAAQLALRQKLGLEGLFYLAQKQGDRAAAGDLALHVLELDPKAGWALDGLMALAIEIGDFPAAEKWLKRWARSGVTRAQIKKRRAVLLTGAAQAALNQDNDGLLTAAVKKAEQAAALAPDFVPAVTLAARLQAAQGKTRKARRLLRLAFAKAPHAELAEAWLDCSLEQGAAARQKAAAQFVRGHATHLESRILRARAAMAAQRWSAARGFLQSEIDATNAPSRRLCQLMADIETGLGDRTAALKWQEQARHAHLDEGWFTHGPNGLIALDAWQPICPVTGQLGGVLWGARAPEPAALAAPAAS